MKNKRFVRPFSRARTCVRTSARALSAVLLLCAMTSGLSAQAVREGDGGARNGQNARESESQIPLRRVVIFASGLAYYEHSGAVNGSVRIAFPFRPDAVNDALKSLVINDPSSANPSITYQSERTLLYTLRSLKIDLSDNPGMAVILERLKGAEVTIAAPSPVFGQNHRR